LGAGFSLPCAALLLSAPNVLGLTQMDRSHDLNAALREPAKRYAFAVAMVAAALGLRKLLEPVSGTGAPFVLFFAAVLVSSLTCGRGPGIVATLLSVPLGAYEFVVRAGYPLSEAVIQAGLFALDCVVVVYMSGLIRRSEAQVRDLIQFAPDAFFLADLEGHYFEVNQAACHMLGYERDELLSMRIMDLIRNEDAPRLAAEKATMSRSGLAVTSEWTVRRKDGTFLPVEVSANILADGRWQAFVRDITERRKREDERRVFESLLENSSDFIGIADPSGTPIYLNPAGRRMVGLPADYPVEHTHIADYYPPEERKFATEVILRSMIERGRWSGETYFRHWQTEAAIPVSDEHFMIRDPHDGRILGMGTVTRDISETRRSRELLQFSEARFSGIISISADAIISIDEHQRITLFNAGAERIFGYSKAEVIGTPLDLLLPERLRALHREHVEGFAAGPEAARQMAERVEIIVGRRKNGEEFPAEAAISKLQLAGRTILTVALRDITARKRIEKEQRFLSEAGAVLGSSLDYEHTLATVGQLVVRDLADWCIVDIIEDDEQLKRLKVVSADPNEAALALQLERIPLDLSRPSLIRLVVASRRPVVIERVTPGELQSFAQSAEHLRLLRAANPRSMMALPLLIRERLLGVLVFISSSPSRVYGPNDIPFAEALAQRAALAIENGRLYRQAVQATQLRDEVLGVVAHDLRNPLSVIVMQSAAQRRRGTGPERRNLQSSETIHRSANRMKRLINDLVDVTMVEAGQLGLDRAAISARQLLVDTVEAQRPLAASASIDMQLALEGPLPDIWADQHRLLQVFENLIGNAIKFTPAGGRITVAARTGEREVLFRVNDTGYGIAPSELPHVFDRFWQARKGRDGAGLGLPIARGIIAAHGGRIWVESTLGRGTTFSFTVPRADAVPDKGASQHRQNEPGMGRAA
jgi:PAS domain S-box-containing protein